MNKPKDPLPPAKEFDRIIRGLTHRHQVWKVFSDFCEMAAISLANAILRDEGREKRYLEIVGGYESDEARDLCLLLAQVVLGLEQGESDFLGEAFMRLDLGSHWHGQFFTPWHLCKAMAMMTAGRDFDVLAGDKGFVTVLEPACGAGAMILALCSSLKDGGVNYQERVHVTAIDVDPTAAHMCYIQISLMHVPAVVYIGDTLSMQMRSAWLTPAHHMGMWEWKLRRREVQAVVEQLALAPDIATPPVESSGATKGPGQMDFDFTVGK